MRVLFVQALCFCASAAYPHVMAGDQRAASLKRGIVHRWEGGWESEGERASMLPD